MVAASIVIIVFLQTGYAIRSRSMLRADFLVTHLPDIAQRILLALGYILGVLFFLMIITGGWQESVLSFVENEFEGEGAQSAVVARSLDRAAGECACHGKLLRHGLCRCVQTRLDAPRGRGNETTRHGTLGQKGRKDV